MDEMDHVVDIDRLALAFVEQERFLWSRPDRASRLQNLGSEQEDLWTEVVLEFVACTTLSDALILPILERYDFDRLHLFGQGYLQPWIEKAEGSRLDWLANLVRTNERARRASAGLIVPTDATQESMLWNLITRY